MRGLGGNRHAPLMCAHDNMEAARALSPLHTRRRSPSAADALLCYTLETLFDLGRKPKMRREAPSLGHNAFFKILKLFVALYCVLRRIVQSALGCALGPLVK